MKFGLIANKLHRKHGTSGLFQWLSASEETIRTLQLELDAIGGTYDAIQDRGYFKSYAKLRRSLVPSNGSPSKLFMLALPSA
jgi:methylglyoxal synthase